MKFRSIQLCKRKSAVFKAIQFKLADMATQREAAELPLLRAAWMEDNHKKCGLQGRVFTRLCSFCTA